MFSRTVMGAKTCRPSGTSEQPWKTTFSGGSLPMSFMSKRISPERARRSPEMVLRRLVFPAPLAPMIVTISPDRMCIETFFSTLSRPYPDSRFLILSMPASRVVPEVHADHFPVLLDREGPVLRDLLPETQYDDLVRDPHDERHVVLHEEHGDAHVADLPDQPAHFVRLPHVQPRGGLVEKQEPRLAREGPADLDDALLPVGEAHRLGVGVPRDAEQFQDLQAPLPDAPLLPPGEREAQHSGEEPRPAVEVASDHHVLEGRHLGEEPDVLERPHHATGGDLVGLKVVDRRLLVVDLAPVGCEESRDQVEQRRLPRAVGPDERLDRPLRDVEGEVVDGLEAAEALADAPHREDRHGTSSSAAVRVTSRFRSARRWRRSSPSGANSMIRMRMMPKTASSSVPKYPRSDR